MKLALSVLVLGLSACSVAAPFTISAAASPDAFECAINAVSDVGYVVEDLEAGMFIRAIQNVDVLTVTVASGRLNVVATGLSSAPSRRARRDATTVLATCQQEEAS